MSEGFYWIARVKFLDKDPMEGWTVCAMEEEEAKRKLTYCINRNLPDGYKILEIKKGATNGFSYGEFKCPE